jgi:hypothetical protein
LGRGGGEEIAEAHEDRFVEIGGRVRAERDSLTSVHFKLGLVKTCICNSIRRILTGKKDGKVVTTGRIDGKTRTVSTSGNDSMGRMMPVEAFCPELSH